MHRLHILYTTLIPCTEGTGPALNENLFLRYCSSDDSIRLSTLLPSTIGRSHSLFAYLSYSYPSQRGPIRFVLGNIVQALFLTYLSFRLKPDVIVIRADAFPLVGLFIKSLIKTPVYLKTQGPPSISGLDSKDLSGFARFLIVRTHSFLNDILLRRSCAIDCVTSEINHSIRRRLSAYPETMSVITLQNAIDTAQFRQICRTDPSSNAYSSEREYTLGYFGNLPLQRGAMNILYYIRDNASSSSRSSIKALIIGCSDKDLSYIQDFAETHGLTQHITALPRMSFSSLLSYFPLIDIGVSLDTLERIRTVGDSALKVRQYVSSGIPFIGTAASKIGNNRLGIELSDLSQDSFTQAVDSLISSICNGIYSRGYAQDYARAHWDYGIFHNQRRDIWRSLLGK